MAARIRAVGVATGLSEKEPARSVVSRRRVAGMLTSSRRSIPQAVSASPEAVRRVLVEDVETMADMLAEVVDHAAALNLAIPPPIANAILDLRGWAARISSGPTAGPVAVDAGRIIAYLRGLPDQQLLAVLADLPWSRLDTLLDAVSGQASSRWRQPP